MEITIELGAKTEAAGIEKEEQKKCTQKFNPEQKSTVEF